MSPGHLFNHFLVHQAVSVPMFEIKLFQYLMAPLDRFTYIFLILLPDFSTLFKTTESKFKRDSFTHSLSFTLL